ncbi:MAG: YbaK/EbsC family protein [Chloroflexota bacterium]
MPVTEADVSRILNELGVPYEIIECDPDYADTAAFCERYGYPLDHSANTILVVSKRGEKKYAACVVLSDSRLDVNHRVRELMDVSRLSFAKPEETAALTGMMIGGVTPVGLPDDVPVYVDSRVMDREYVVLGGGSRSAKIKISPSVFKEMSGARIVHGLALES